MNVQVARVRMGAHVMTMSTDTVVLVQVDGQGQGVKLV